MRPAHSNEPERQRYLTLVQAAGVTQTNLALMLDRCREQVYRWGTSEPVPRYVMVVLTALTETRLAREALERATGQGPPGFMNEEGRK